MEVPRVPVNAEPLMLYRAHYVEHLIDGIDNAAVIFQGEIDTVLAGMIASLLDGLDAACAGLLFRIAFVHAAGKDADGVAAQQGRVLHPLFDRGDLLSEPRWLSDAKIVADRRAAHVEAK